MNTPASRRFHSFLAPQLEAYVQFRQNLGYTSFAKPYNALDLDHYVLFYGIDSVEKLNEGAVFHWVHSIPERKAHTKNQRISFARGFFRYLIRVGLAQANPAQNIRRLIPKPPPRHIYTLLEIQQILDEARKLQGRTPKSVLLGSTLETMILLIYACGLRISEALKLTIEDVDFEENTLSLWRTKFHKERLVPFSDPIAQKLKSYLAIRRRCFPPQSDQAPFFCHKGGEYHGCTIEVHFLCILIRCGLAKPGQGRGHPRIHDLRHTFACHRLYKWYQEGHDLMNKLPLLSTYMGHVDIQATQVYLTITLVLLREGDRRFQGSCEGVAQKSLKRALKNL
jgi:integrase